MSLYWRDWLYVINLLAYQPKTITYSHDIIADLN
jgi:hypothetical protein